MLINKGFSSGDIISLKLINGEELIARFDEESTDSIKVLKPLCVTLNGQGLGMMPWMFLGNSKEVTLKKAYDHYKLLEALCELPTEPKE